MVAEAFANFATTSLVSPSPLNTTALSFTVTAGQGSLFPSANFYVTMDVEVMLIASRSGDTFTVASGGRGYDGSQASSHNAAAIIQQTLCKGNMLHIWQNLADTYRPQVPPVQLGNTPSQWDNEFESLGSSWVLYPANPIGAGGSWDAGTTLKSHLLLNRGFNDNATYTAYVPFTYTGSFTMDARISEATQFLTLYDSRNELQTRMFVSDQANPTSGSGDSGNRYHIETNLRPNWVSGNVAGVLSRYARITVDTAGVVSYPGFSLPLTPGYPVWLRIQYDAINGAFYALIGDGTTYSMLGNSGFHHAMNVQTIGFTFNVYAPGGQPCPHTVAIDYVRVTTGLNFTSYGGP